MVFMPYYYYHGTEDSPILQPISTGMACHCSPAEAAITAVCEVIERDAFSITWQAMLAPPRWPSSR
jgi:ribosomal protein S12 methylthiotransferase accessory factor